MKNIIMVIFLWLNNPVWAHHTKDHMMLAEETQQVIDNTQQGASAPWAWIIWSFVVMLLLLAIVRWIKRSD